MTKDEFYLKVAHALSGCQLVEQELKLYITEAFDLVRKCVGTTMTFRLKGTDYEDSSLERLIHMFSGLTGNDRLVSDLRKFKDKRNLLSHKGITQCLDYEGELCYTTATEFQSELASMQEEAEKLRSEIHEEANKFLPHLWFDPIPVDESADSGSS